MRFLTQLLLAFACLVQTSLAEEATPTEVWSRPEPEATETNAPDIFKIDTDASSPELVKIFSINGRALAEHPPMIDVLPGQQVSLRADVLQFGNACPHPEGCPEGRDSDQFTWHADDRDGNECSARSPEGCTDRTEFEPQGNEMIFHIPFPMTRDITLRVSHRDVSSTDHIVLHNARLPHQRAGYERPFPTTPYNYYPEEPAKPQYPSIAPSGINQPYGYVPYDPYWVGWHPVYPGYYPYGPYPAYPVTWYGGSGVFISFGVVYNPWWWGPRYWWGPHYWAGPRYWGHPIYAQPHPFYPAAHPIPMRPMGGPPGAPPVYRRRGGFRGRWR